MLSKIHIHTSDINWEDFYQKHIPKSHLPCDYGGELPSVAELSKQEHKTLIGLKEYFENEERQIHYGYDDQAEESKYAEGHC
jgi:hypothetical protein